jgi:hypothetical protein
VGGREWKSGIPCGWQWMELDDSRKCRWCLKISTWRLMDGYLKLNTPQTAWNSIIISSYQSSIFHQIDWTEYTPHTGYPPSPYASSPFWQVSPLEILPTCFFLFLLILSHLDYFS